MSLSSVGLGKHYLPPEEDPKTCGTTEGTKLKIIIYVGGLSTVAGMGLMIGGMNTMSLPLGMSGLALMGAGIFTYFGGFTWYCRRDVCYIRPDEVENEEQLQEIKVVADKALNA